MRAVVFRGPGTVEVADVPAPQVQDAGDAVVDVAVSAICGSDLHLLDGKTPGMREGGVIGHEFVGTVRDAGPEAGVEAGTRVLGSFLIACGTCDMCSSSRFNLCRNRRALGLGVLTGDLDGAQAESVRVPTAHLNLKALDGALADLDDEHALFGGDVLTTGFYAASLCADSEVVAVIGAGPVGMFTAQALEASGSTVLVLDVDAHRIEAAGALLKRGRALVVDGDNTGAVVAGATEGRMADAVVEAVGTVDAFKSSLRCVRDGGRIAVVGVYGTERYALPMGVAWVRGLEIVFSGMANIHAHWDAALGAVTAGTIDPTALITHRLPLDEAPKGYELFAAREATKVVLRP